MSTCFGYLSSMENKDLISTRDSGQSVASQKLVMLKLKNGERYLRNDKHGSPFGQRSQRLLDVLLGIRV
jgi:hypothetical protein